MHLKNYYLKSETCIVKTSSYCTVYCPGNVNNLKPQVMQPVWKCVAAFLTQTERRRPVWLIVRLCFHCTPLSAEGRPLTRVSYITHPVCACAALSCWLRRTRKRWPCTKLTSAFRSTQSAHTPVHAPKRKHTQCTQLRCVCACQCPVAVWKTSGL